MYSLRDEDTTFLFLQHLLPSVKLIKAEPSLCFSSDQISNQSLRYVLPVRFPWAWVIRLHKSTVMNTCTSLKVLPSGSGFSFGDVRPFEVNFPLIHNVGSFSFVSSLISSHVSDETCHELMSLETAP